MFDVGFGELLLIAVVALVVLGPERLPGAARTAGALLRRLRNGWASVRDEVEKELHAEEFKRNLRDVEAEVREAESRARESLRATADEVRHTVEGSDDAPKDPPP
ncbi:MAG TPA: Sec-independent protein translocase protein TatB [Rhodanobacteraceae bacterium]|jgi:sec-independent protein translocase protein TatB|nr:Sec-independent protein translocase protein TatB [Rhodanobacteraceae bacterium]